MMTVLAFYFFNSEVVLMFLQFIFGSYALIYLSMGLTYGGLMMLDHLSFLLLLLSLLTFFITILCVFYEKVEYAHWGHMVFFFMSLLIFLLYLFSSMDFFCFYVFFELTVIPTFILIVGWGYSVNRLQASFYMILFMLVASYPFFMSFFYMSTLGLSFNFFYFMFFEGFCALGTFWWLMFILVFGAKLPLFFLHLWLPKAHVDAPLLGSMVLAGVLLKMGGYGLYSVSFFFMSSFSSFLWALGPYGLFGSLLVSVVCLRQLDLKSLVAYSSVVHMGPVFSCFFFLSYYSLMGSFLMMFSHGICSCVLFYLVNVVYKWFHSRSLFLVRGALMLTAIFFYFWGAYCLFNMGCPPSFNFFSEIFVLFSSALYGKGLIYIFFLVMLFVGFYCVVLMVTVGHGEPSHMGSCFFQLKLSDYCVVSIFCVVLVWFIMFLFIFSC